MGLDIELYYCEDWDKILSDRKKFNDFANSLDWEILNPDWFNTVGKSLLEEGGRDEFNLHVLDSSENRKIFEEQLVPFAQQNRIPLHMVVVGKEGFLEIITREFQVKMDTSYNPLWFRMNYNSHNLNHMLKQHGFATVAQILGVPEDYDERGDDFYVNVAWEDSLSKLDSVISSVKDVELLYPFDNYRHLYLEQLSRLHNILQHVIASGMKSKYRIGYSD